MLVVTLALPRTSLGFIDRCFVSAEAFEFRRWWCLTKDLLDEEGLKQETIKALPALALLVSISAKHEDQSQILQILKNKTTLVAGHSGVGKSALLNKISPSIKQSIGEIPIFRKANTPPRSLRCFR
jgi:ribosome biogenesis GTPase